MTAEPIVPPVPPDPPTGSEEPSPSAFARIAGVIVSPDETFASIARRPDWVVPLVLWMVIALVGGIIFAQKVDFGEAARASMEDSASEMSEDQREAGIKVAAAMGKVLAYAAPLVAAIVLLIVACIVHFALRLFGGEGTFKQSFSATLYAWVPNTIQSILTYIVVLSRGEVDATQLDTVLKSNLGFLVSLKSNPIGYVLLSSLDIFTIWTLVLFAIAFAHVMRMSKGKTAGIIVPLWVVYVLFKLVPAAMRSMRE